MSMAGRAGVQAVLGPGLARWLQRASCRSSAGIRRHLEPSGQSLGRKQPQWLIPVCCTNIIIFYVRLGMKKYWEVLVLGDYTGLQGGVFGDMDGLCFSWSVISQHALLRTFLSQETGSSMWLGSLRAHSHPATDPVLSETPQLVLTYGNFKKTKFIHSTCIYWTHCTKLWRHKGG